MSQILNSIGTKKYTVLIVDDSVELTILLEMLLKSHNYEVDIAYTGEEGLRKAQKIPDAILLDRTLPDIEGLEVCRRIRENNSLNCVPIIFLTARDADDDIVDGLYIGGDDYITKPYDNSILLARINAAIRRKEFTRNRETSSFAISEELNDIIEHEKIASFFQPIFSLKSSAAIGTEAFSRASINSILNNNKTLFRKSLDHGKYLSLETICWNNAITKWKKSPQNGQLFLNCYPNYIENNMINNKFFNRFGINPEDIVVEINENNLIQNVNSFIEKLAYMRMLGAKVSIDDFGKGFLTLLGVKNISPDFLKIDISLFRDVRSQSFKQKIFESIVKFAQKQNIHLIIECVEFEEELEFINKFPIDTVQGNLFCLPNQKIENNAINHDKL